MRVEVIAEANMPVEIDRQIRELLVLCFPKDKEIFSQTRIRHGAIPHFSAVIFQENQLIAHAGAVDRVIQVGNTPIHVYGVQNVVVHPDHRGQRLVGKILGALKIEAIFRDYDGGLLFCRPHLDAMYARYGWQSLKDRNILIIGDYPPSFGKKVPLSTHHSGMYLPLKVSILPTGTIDLCGGDW